MCRQVFGGFSCLSMVAFFPRAVRQLSTFFPRAVRQLSAVCLLPGLMPLYVCTEQRSAGAPDGFEEFQIEALNPSHQFVPGACAGTWLACLEQLSRGVSCHVQQTTLLTSFGTLFPALVQLMRAAFLKRVFWFFIFGIILGTAPIIMNGPRSSF